jgi:hypothetical protein
MDSYITGTYQHRKANEKVLYHTIRHMMSAFHVHPDATFSTRSRLHKNASVPVLTIAIICAVFLSPHRILASTLTSSRIDEGRELKVCLFCSAQNSSRTDVFFKKRNQVVKFQKLWLSIYNVADHHCYGERFIAG